MKRGGDRVSPDAPRPRGRAPRIVVSLSPEARKALDTLAKRWRVSRAEAIRRAVQAAAEEGE